MRGVPALGLIAAAGAVLLAWAAAWLAGAAGMATYLAVWLAFLGIPTGALPLVLALELAGRGGSLHGGFLRLLLVLMPVAALAGLPVLLAGGVLHPWVQGSADMAARWFSPLLLGVRGGLVLGAWSVLALACLRPPEGVPRLLLCTGGLSLHMALATVAVADWVTFLAPGSASAGLGLLLMAAQCGTALSAGLLLCRATPPGAVLLLLVTACVWAGLHLTHYLVVWSADLPGEAAWYLARAGIAGVAAVWLGLAAWLAALVLLGVAGLGGRRPVLVGCAGVLLAAHVAEMLWLVTPSLRGTFVISPGDLAGLAMLVAVCAALAWTWRPLQVAA